jgi:hypothetical protein
MRMLFPFGVMAVAPSASRSSSAVVSFSSPAKTLGHSEKLRLLVSMTLLRS